MMQAVLSNASHPDYGVATIPFPIPREQFDHCIGLLEALEISNASARDCHVDEIRNAWPVLTRLEGRMVNLDELDYLAKRLDSFDDGEAAQFQAMAHKLELFELKDLINLTFCCQQATVITDFSDLNAVGRDHYFKMIRYSFSGSAKSFGGKPCDIRRFFHLIWECSRRLAGVVIENKDFEDLIRQYDREDAWIYCDPPYFEAECYEVDFPKENHQRLHDVLLECKGYVMVSYNYCDYISELYKEFYIFRTVRPNSMSQKAGSEYEEAIITNYDPRRASWQLSLEGLLDGDNDSRYELMHEPEIPLKTA